VLEKAKDVNLKSFLFDLPHFQQNLAEYKQERNNNLFTLMALLLK